jgi:2-methylisocitrate lyase-like PEP mutase family enzyme
LTDIEAGYADTVKSLKENIVRVMEMGVVGIDIEDSLVEGGSLRSIDIQCECIAAVREVASLHNLHLVNRII